jgi:hypothetical protein
MMRFLLPLLRLLPIPTKRHEFWVKLPLGIWPGKQYHLERLEETEGLHYWYLLVCLDGAPAGWHSKRAAGWRLQWQRKAVPLTRTVRL